LRLDDWVKNFDIRLAASAAVAPMRKASRLCSKISNVLARSKAGAMPTKLR
jgi:hypothetical protein